MSVFDSASVSSLRVVVTELAAPGAEYIPELVDSSVPLISLLGDSQGSPCHCVIDNDTRVDQRLCKLLSQSQYLETSILQCSDVKQNHLGMS